MKQRLRLASVSPKLLDDYAEDGMVLEQLMACTVSGCGKVDFCQVLPIDGDYQRN